MRAEYFDPAADTAAVRALHAIYVAGLPADDPHGPGRSFLIFGGWLAVGWTGVRRETWLVPDDAPPVAGGPAGDAGPAAPERTGGPADGTGARSASRTAAGGYVLELPDRDNTDQGQLTVMVAPAGRRKGLGTALLCHAAGRAREHGRTVLTGETREGSPGEAFARSVGARPGITEVRRVLHLASVPAGRLDELRAMAEKAAGGYSLLSWEGPVPGEHVNQVAALNSAMADAPRAAGDEAESWDAERVRDTDHRVALQGLRSYTVAARHDLSGELAGLTQIGVDPSMAAWGFQELTAVARPHRGHRLGLLVKLAMLELLAGREPQISRIITGNAESNKHMIAINEALGFQILDRWTESWRLSVADACALRSAAGLSGG